MNATIKIDRSGRLVLPKAIRERLNLDARTRLQVEVVAGRVELTPVPSQKEQGLKTKRGIKVLGATGTPADAAAAVAAERRDQVTRGVTR